MKRRPDGASEDFDIFDVPSVAERKSKTTPDTIPDAVIRRLPRYFRCLRDLYNRDILRVSSAETEFILRYPEERDCYTPEAEKALFEKLNASDSDAMIACLVEGKVAGNCHVRWSKSLKIRHRASVGIALMSPYWNQGIGTMMFREMIRIAEETPYILQMELDFIEGNSRARALYEKMGFRITGMKPNAIRLKNGTLLNEYSMIREIRR